MALLMLGKGVPTQVIQSQIRLPNQVSNIPFNSDIEWQFHVHNETNYKQQYIHLNTLHQHRKIITTSSVGKTKAWSKDVVCLPCCGNGELTAPAFFSLQYFKIYKFLRESFKWKFKFKYPKQCNVYILTRETSEIDSKGQIIPVA